MVAPTPKVPGTLVRAGWTAQPTGPANDTFSDRIRCGPVFLTVTFTVETAGPSRSTDDTDTSVRGAEGSGAGPAPAATGAKVIMTNVASAVAPRNLRGLTVLMDCSFCGSARTRAQATGGMSVSRESRPMRRFTQEPRVKSGISTGRPPAARDLTLSGTGEHQAAES